MDYKKGMAASEPISFIGDEKADMRFYDGALRHALGAKHFQVVRANREFPQTQEDYGWTYNHAPMICFWDSKFFIQYLSNPVSEHQPPSHTLLTWSKLGEDWTKPEVVFPQYVLPSGVYTGPKKELLGPGDTAVMHQRMGFYVTRENRLLTLGFYGVSPEVHTSPNNGYGVARVVREIFADGTFSPVYVIMYNTYGGFEPKDVEFPFYESSSDQGFIRACQELLANKLVTRQWWEEQRLNKDYFPHRSEQAFCYYTNPKEEVVGLHKHAYIATSTDGGNSWSQFTKCNSIETSTGKIWGEKTEDGNFALVYNPSVDTMHRWPLAVATGSDGVHFANLLTLTPFVPPTRYTGWAKNLGPQYVRGIIEANPKPDDGHLWLTYSMNKEDIWVCKVPVPIEGRETHVVDEDFAQADLKWWNLYSPKWGRVRLEKGRLAIADSDPYDLAAAMRIFKESQVVTIETEVVPATLGQAGLYLDLADRTGSQAVRIHFNPDGNLYVKSNGVYNNMGPYQPGCKYAFEITADCLLNSFAVTATGDGDLLFAKKFRFNASVRTLERFIFRTKDQINPYNLESNGKDGSMKDLPDSGYRQPETKFYVTLFKAHNYQTKGQVPS